jgi:hypothetical protein
VGKPHHQQQQQPYSNPNQLVVKVQFDKNQFLIQVNASSPVEDVMDKVVRKGSLARFLCFSRHLCLMGKSSLKPHACTLASPCFAVTSARPDIQPRELVMLWTDLEDDQVQLK